MKKILPLFASIALLVGVSAANAGEPMQLTTAQMDKVTAGVSDTSQYLRQTVTTTATSTATTSGALSPATAVSLNIVTVAGANLKVF